MLKPRNTFILVDLIEQAERRVGAITVPTNNDCYCEAEVIAVGPGNIAANGGRSETFDLKVGQRVFVKHKARMQGPVGPVNELLGLLYEHEGKRYYLFEQASVIGVVGEPV
jgi:co-chaperonin GroES (HSP10)